MDRVFTHAEASALLPDLTALLTALRTAHRAALEHAGESQHAVSSNGSAAAAVHASKPFNEAQRLSSEIDDLGVLLRDPETGLVDFPSLREGQEIYLCWRLGEHRIGYWHPRDTGFIGRLPI
jgi:hypothetical protein